MAYNQNFKTIVNIPGWVDAFGSGDKLNDGSSAYKTVPLVFRCTRLIADSLASVELKVYKGKGADKQEVDWPFDEDPQDWVWKTVSSLLLLGASYSVKKSNALGNKVLGLQWINPLSVQPVVNEATGEIFFRRQGNVAGGSNSQWTANEMLYIKEFNMGSDVMPGTSAAGVALTDAGLIRYLTKFASYYFEQGAMPLTILPIPVNTQADEVKRVERLFKSLATGIKRAFSVVAMRTGKDSGAPFTITPPLKDLVMKELHDQSRQSIADAFGIPKTMLDDAANFATATEHTTQFWTTCVRPKGNMIKSKLNREVFKALGLTCEFAFDELDVFQEDEANRATSLKTLKEAGIPLVMAIDILGYDLTDKQLEELTALETPAPATPALPAIIPDPEDKEGGPSAEAVRSALYYWKKAALTAVGKGSAVDFDTLDIPEDAASRIREALEGCKSTDEVHAVFKKAREWVKNPVAHQSPHQGPLSPHLTSSRESTANASSPRGGEEALILELKRANDLLAGEKSQSDYTFNIPAPVVTVNLPEQPPTVINVAAPNVDIKNDIQPAAVEVQTIPAPVVEVKNEINLPEREPVSLKVTRDSKGNISGIKE